MSTDDRFFSFTCIAAALITTTVFVLSNHGDLFASRGLKNPVATCQKIPIVDTPGPEKDPKEVRASHKPEPHSANSTFVRAVNKETDYPGDTAAATASCESPPTLDWLAEIVDAVIDGRNISPALSIVPPRYDVLVRKSNDGRTVVASGTHRRYEGLSTSLENLNTGQVVALLENPDEPVSASSHSRSELRSRITRALAVVLAVDEPDFEPSMQSDGRLWQFAEPEYAALSPAQQHLLLMGRANAKVVRDKLQSIYDGLIASEVTSAESSAMRGVLITAVLDPFAENRATAP